MAKKLEKPITDYNEYKRRLRKVKIIRFLSITIPLVFVVCATIIFFSKGRVLSVFGVKNFRLVMDIYYGTFYVLVGIVCVIILVLTAIFLINMIIDFIKGLKK